LPNATHPERGKCHTWPLMRLPPVSGPDPGFLDQVPGI